MTRYHIKVYMPNNIKSQLKRFTDNLNTLKWQYTAHSIDNIKSRWYNISDILSFINKTILKEKDIFEVYIFDNKIIKACYRIKYNSYDIILVLNDNKKIITIYMNNKDDEHITLNRSLYQRN